MHLFKLSVSYLVAITVVLSGFSIVLAADSPVSEITNVINEITEIGNGLSDGQVPSPSQAPLPSPTSGVSQPTIISIDQTVGIHESTIEKAKILKASLKSYSQVHDSVITKISELKELISANNTLIGNMQTTPEQTSSLSLQIREKDTAIAGIVDGLKSDYFNPLMTSVSAFETQTARLQQYRITRTASFKVKTDTNEIKWEQHGVNTDFYNQIEGTKNGLNTKIREIYQKLDGIKSVVSRNNTNIDKKAFRLVIAIPNDILAGQADFSTFSTDVENKLESLINSFFQIYYERNVDYNSVDFPYGNHEWYDDLVNHINKNIQVPYAGEYDFYRNRGFNNSSFITRYIRIKFNGIDTISSLEVKDINGNDLSDYAIDRDSIQEGILKANQEKLNYILLNWDSIKAKLPDPSSSGALLNQDLGQVFPSPVPSPLPSPYVKSDASLGAKPAKVKFILKGKSASKDVTVEKEILLIPAFNESYQVYGQCTWFAGYMMKFAQKESADTYNKIMPTYDDTFNISGNPLNAGFPKKGSIITSNGHMAYVSDIVKVSDDVVPGQVPCIKQTYNLLIAQANIKKHDGTPEYYPTTMEVHYRPTSDTYTITKYPNYGTQNNFIRVAQKPRSMVRNDMMTYISNLMTSSVPNRFFNSLDFIRNAYIKGARVNPLPSSLDQLLVGAGNVSVDYREIFEEYIRKSDRYFKQEDFNSFKALIKEIGKHSLGKNFISADHMIRNLLEFSGKIDSCKSYREVVSVIESYRNIISLLDFYKHVSIQRCADSIKTKKASEVDDWLRGDVIFLDIPVRLSTINNEELMNYDGVPDLAAIYAGKEGEDMFFYIAGDNNPFSTDVVQQKGNLYKLKFSEKSFLSLFKHKRIILQEYTANE